MQKKQYKISIDASAEKVFRIMLGLDNIKTYETWTALFNPTSTYEGNWEKGSKIYFIGTGENGEKGGMIAEIEENIPNKYISIRHYGILDGDKEITSGEEIESWAGSHENYLFVEENGKTTVTVEVDVTPDHFDFFDITYPKALDKLKEIIEK